MELKDTVDLMTSQNYKDRFKAEYYQLEERYNKLENILVKNEAGTLEFMPNCSMEILYEQYNAMGAYLRCLKVRAEMEGVAL